MSASIKWLTTAALLAASMACAEAASGNDDLTVAHATPKNGPEIAKPRTAEEYIHRASDRYDRGDIKGALADANEAIRLAPKVAVYYRNRSLVLANMGDEKGVLANLNRALTLAPADPDLLWRRADAHLHLANPTAALADTKAAERAYPPDTLDLLHITSLYEDLYQPARTIPIYDRIIAGNPSDPRLWMALNGRCWARALANVDLNKALADCNRAVDLDGSHPSVLDSRALVKLRMGNPEGAIADYDAMLDLAPTMAWSLYMRGLAKLALGQTRAGDADMSTALSIEPDIAARAARYGLTG